MSDYVNNRSRVSWSSDFDHYRDVCQVCYSEIQTWQRTGRPAHRYKLCYQCAAALWESRRKLMLAKRGV